MEQFYGIETAEGQQRNSRTIERGGKGESPEQVRRERISTAVVLPSLLTGTVYPAVVKNMARLYFASGSFYDEKNI